MAMTRGYSVNFETLFLSHKMKQYPLLRLAYLRHDWKEIEFRIPQRGYALMPIGLLRQSNELCRFMTSGV